MIKFHNLLRLVFGFCMVEFCRFFYFMNYNTGPSYSRLNPAGTSLSAEQQKLLNVTPSSKYTGLYQLGDQNLYLSGNQIWQQDQSGNYYLEPLGTNTRFKQYTGDVAGFNKSGADDSTVYDISPAYLYSKRMANQNYVPFSAQQAPLQAMGYNPALGLTQGSGIYSPAVGNLLSAPTAMTAPTGNYGAGRFLNNGLLGLNFGLNNYANGVSRYSPTIEQSTMPQYYVDTTKTGIPSLDYGREILKDANWSQDWLGQIYQNSPLNMAFNIQQNSAPNTATTTGTP